jgi:hypothetical protein
MSNQNREQPARRCPRCGSTRVAEIVYGLPSAELLEASRKGKIALGGCVIEPDIPTWLCRACGEEWGSLG